LFNILNIDFALNNKMICSAYFIACRAHVLCCVVLHRFSVVLKYTIAVTSEAIRLLPVAYRVSQQPGSKRKSRSGRQ